LTRVAALLLAFEMAVAILKVHSAGGYIAVHNYEFPLPLGDRLETYGLALGFPERGPRPDSYKA